MRCDPSRYVHVYALTIMTDRNATHEKRIRVEGGRVAHTFLDIIYILY